MMILNDRFYTIHSRSFQENQLTVTLELNEKDTIFEGHFPGNPVTPGVVQLEIIKELLQLHFEQDIQLKTMSNCKYLAILDPRKNSHITVTISITEVDSEIKINAQFSGEGIIFTKVAAVYSRN